MKLGCAYSFVVMIDMWCILIVINSYLKLKTYSITFINCLNKGVWQKLNEMWESWKRFKTLCMGHGAWMGIAWGKMEDGWMGSKHSSQNVTCFCGICFKGLGCPCIETCVGLPVESWHVLMGGRFQGFCFKAHVSWDVVFDQWKWMSGCRWNMTCFRVNLLWGSHCLCVETCVGSLWNKRCIYDLLL